MKNGIYKPAFLWILLVVSFAGFAPVAFSEFYGRIDTGFLGYLSDDTSIEDRLALVERLKLHWDFFQPGTWCFISDVRFKEETDEAGGGPHIQIWDLRFNYGLDTHRTAGSAGWCYLPEVSGLGSVLGLHLQTNWQTRYSAGFFSGANPVTREGTPNVDGVRSGGYFRYRQGPYNSAGIGFVTVSGAEDENDDFKRLVFDTSWQFRNKFYWMQSGEYDFSSHDRDAALTCYFMNARFDACERITLGISYSHSKRFPQLQSVLDYQYFGISEDPYGENRGFLLDSNSVSPKIEFRLTDRFRVYMRYRFRESDYFHQADWNQYLAGLIYSDIFSTGFDLNAFGGVNDGGFKEYQTGSIVLSKMIGKQFSLQTGGSFDSFSQPSHELSALYSDDSYRLFISGVYRLNRNMNFLLDYDYSRSGSDTNHQILFNFQYRL